MSEEKGKNKAFTSRDTDLTMEDQAHSFGRQVLNSASSLLRDSVSSSSVQSFGSLTNPSAREGKAGPSGTSTTQGPGGVLDTHWSVNTHSGSQSSDCDYVGFRGAAVTDRRLGPLFGGGKEEISLDQFVQRSNEGDNVPIFEHNLSAGGMQRNMSDVGNPPHRGQPRQTVSDTRYPMSSAFQGSRLISQPIEGDGAEVVKLLQNPSDPAVLYTIDGDEIPAAMSRKELSARTLDLTKTFPTTLSSFFDQIQNYQDEVWGDMQPLVEKAEREGDQHSSSIGKDGPATRRLRQILAQVEASG